MVPPRSPYYPPRAQWYSGVWYLWYWFLHAKRVTPVLRLATHRFLASCIIPGLAFGIAGRRIIAWAAVLAYGGCLLLLAIRLGHPEATFAFGMMISIHTSSVLFAIERTSPVPLILSQRTCYAMGLVLFMGVAIYFPMRRYVMDHWALPISVKGRIIVVRPSRSRIDRGDWVVYRMQPRSGAGVNIAGGIAYAHLIAMSGDQLRFTPFYVMVNETFPDQIQPDMPVHGEPVVPEKRCFIWPDLAIPARGGGGSMVSDLKMQMAEVPENDVIGKPYTRWFWRKQQLP